MTGSCRRPTCSSGPRPRSIDETEVDAAGDALVHALAAHGVETRLVGRTVGPSVTRYELELGAGRQGGPGDVACPRTSPTPWPRPTCASWPPSRASRPSASRSRTARRQLVALRRHPRLARGRPRRHPPARGGPGPRHRRPCRHGQPGRDAPRPGLGRHRLGQVLVHQLGPHLDPHPGHPRPGPAHPDRPQAGGARPVQRPARTCSTQVVVDPKKAANALSWAVTEMERRYDLLAEVGHARHHRLQPGVRLRATSSEYEEAYRLRMRGTDAEVRRGRRRPARFPPPAVHPHRGGRAQRPDDGGGPRRRGVGRAASPRWPGPWASTWCSPPSARRST